MLVYGARFNDPSIARFTTIDPLTEQFPHQSGYVYADNDPKGKIDFMGLSGESSGMGRDPIDPPVSFVYYADEVTVTPETYSSRHSSWDIGSPIRKNYNSEASKGNYLTLKGDVSFPKHIGAPDGLISELQTIAAVGIGVPLLGTFLAPLIPAGIGNGIGVNMSTAIAASKATAIGATKATAGQRLVSFGADYTLQRLSSAMTGSEFNYNLASGMSSLIFAAPTSSSMMAQNFFGSGAELTTREGGGMNGNFNLTKGLIGGAFGYGFGRLNKGMSNQYDAISITGKLYWDGITTVVNNSAKTGVIYAL